VKVFPPSRQEQKQYVCIHRKQSGGQYIGTYIHMKEVYVNADEVSQVGKRARYVITQELEKGNADNKVEFKMY